MPISVQIMHQSEDLCEMLCRFLRSEGHLAVCSSDFQRPGCITAQSGLCSATSRPDLIILEVAMPESEAIAVLEKLQKSSATRNIPIIVISDFQELEIELNNYFDFILKPVDLRRLREDVEMLRAGRKRRIDALELKPLNSSEHQLFHDFLIKHCGLHFERRNIKMLERALRNRMEPLHISSYYEYYEYLQQNMEKRQELQKLIQFLTVGETFFFRYHAHFEVLAKNTLSELLNSPAKKGIRIWSAGCSTGEEPYTVAMTIMESIPDWKKRDIKIIATDINSRSLRRAREGVYGAWKVRVTPKHYIEKYFNVIGESYVVRDEVKSLVEFSYANLQTHTPLPADSFDIVLCRNVMIYFTTATTRKVVEMFADALKPGGYLYLGHSETLMNVSARFERHIHDGNFYYKKKGVIAPEVEKQLQKSRTGAVPNVTRAEVVAAGLPKKQAPLKSAPVEPVNPEELFKKGQALLHQELYAKAAELLQAALELEPGHTGAILASGQIHLAQGRRGEAASCIERALQLNDLLPEGYYMKGLLLEMDEMLDRAIEEYRKAVLLNIDFVMPHYQLGKLCFRSGDTKASARELKNCIRLLEKASREAVIPFTGGLSREVFMGQVRRDLEMVERATAI